MEDAMIQVYNKLNYDFDKNGDAVLLPTEAHTYSEINGSWSASLSHPIDPEGRWKLIVTDNVVKMPSHNGEQLYRIIKTTKTFDSIEAEMRPIFFDSGDDCFLYDVRPTQKTGQQALDIMTAANPKYSGWSDIETVTTAYFEYKNLMEAISGDGDNAFLARWGGEIEYDNFTVKIHARMGEDRAFPIVEGKNIADGGFSYEFTYNSINRVYPVAFNGRKYSRGYVEIAEPYSSHPRGAVVEFPNIVLQDDAGAADFTDPTVQVARNQSELDVLLVHAAYYWMARESDARNQQAGDERFEIEYIDLRVMQGYSGTELEEMEALHLGDSVRLDIPSLFTYHPTRRVTAIEYDSINECISKITLGKVGDYFSNMSKTLYRVDSATTPSGTVKAEEFAGALTGYVSFKGISNTPTSNVELNRLGDMVTLIFNNKPIQQAATYTLQSWSIPEGYRPAATHTFFLPTFSGIGSLVLQPNGNVYFTPPNANNNYYASSITFRTGDPMPAES